MIKDYLNHVIEEGKAIAKKTRHQKLYTQGGEEYYNETGSMWRDIQFEHPSTFAYIPNPLSENYIVNDLMLFKKSKDYYKRIEMLWKRKYLLYGPPGIGKSNMIAAMANLLKYDIYDIKLNSVKSNMELRMLMVQTSSQSLIVLEDVDCSLDLTGKRKDKKQSKSDQEDKDIIAIKDKKKKRSEVTLSGLLNLVDGLSWHSGRGRIVVFATNYVEKLDPELLRRMDMHIQMS
nr:AAA+ ATPase domain-containing protein [Tanacetum cinerariifolium]